MRSSLIFGAVFGDARIRRGVANGARAHRLDQYAQPSAEVRYCAEPGTLQVDVSLEGDGLANWVGRFPIVGADGGNAMTRLVKVSMWELTDQELDDQAAQCEATAPDDAAEFRRVKASQQTIPRNR